MTTAHTRKLMKHAVPMALTLLFAGCSGSGGSDVDEEPPARSGGGEAQAEETPAPTDVTPVGDNISGGVFDASTYTALPTAATLSGLWMAVYVQQRNEGNVVNGSFDTVRRQQLVRRELVRIDDNPQGSTISYCGEQARALQIADGTVSHDATYLRGFGDTVSLHVEENGSLRMTSDTTVDADHGSLTLFYSAIQITRDLTLVRIANAVPDTIGTLQMSWSQTWPETTAGSSTGSVGCFAEQRETVTVPGVIEDEMQRAMFGSEYLRHVLYVDGSESRWAFSQTLGKEGLSIRQQTARELKADPPLPSSIWWTGDGLIDVTAYEATCYAARICPSVTLIMNALQLPTADEVDDFINAPTPLFVQQPHVSTQQTTTLTTTINASADGFFNPSEGYLNASVDLHW